MLSTIGGVEASVILDALRTALGPGVPIIGGGAAPRDPSSEADGASSREFAGDVLAGDALAILLFAGPLAFSFGVETGWRGVGPRATVTRTSDAGVLEIDGRPALEFYERYVGAGPPPVANPLAVFEEPGSDRFYLRTPMAYDRERGSIDVLRRRPGGRDRPAHDGRHRPDLRGREGLDRRRAGALPGRASGPTARCSSRARRASSCWGREPAARSSWCARSSGTAMPIGGLYCMGEIAPMASADRTRFHNATMVSVLLGSAPADAVEPA